MIGSISTLNHTIALSFKASLILKENSLTLLAAGVGDARIFENSAFYSWLEAANFTQYMFRIGGNEIHPYIVGDSAYTMKKFLLKAFDDSSKAGYMKAFNRRIKRARCAVERAFGRLKERFRILKGPISLSLEKVPLVVVACCLLHNICQDNSEEMDWNNVNPEEKDEDGRFAPRQHNSAINSTVRYNPVAARKALAQYYEQNQ